MLNRFRNFPISLPVKPVEVSANTSQSLSSIFSWKEGTGMSSSFWFF